VVEDPNKVGLSPSCPNTCVLPCTYCGPCMRPVGTSGSILRGQIEGESPLLQQMQIVLMHLTYRGYWVSWHISLNRVRDLKYCAWEIALCQLSGLGWC
jgi:hypothetical protein